MKHVQFTLLLFFAIFATACGDPVLGFPASDGTTQGDGLEPGDGFEPTDAFIVRDGLIDRDAMVVIDEIAPTVLRVNPERDETDVAVNVDIIVTFSEPMDPDTLEGKLTLSADGVAVLGTVSNRDVHLTFDPLTPLVVDTVYTATLAEGATDRSGNVLVAGVTWTFTTSTILDETRPLVIATNPADQAVFVATNSPVVAVFSEPMEVDSVLAAFTLLDGATPVAGFMDYSGVIATFRPTDPLTSNTSYTARFAATAADRAGNTLAAPYTWTFTTGIFGDNTRPTVVATNPLDGADFVFTRTSVVAIFSEAMDSDSVMSAFSLRDGVTPVPGVLTYFGQVATFNPTDPLAGNREYTGTFSMVAADLVGNTMAAPYVWTFTTGAAPDETPPFVVVTVPANNAAEIDLDASIVATFSEPMDGLSVIEAFQIFDGFTAVDGSVSAAGAIGTFNPATDLEPEHEYTGIITTAATDRAGNAMLEDFVFSFTTGEAPDLRLPRVSDVVPADGATNVATVSQVLAIFTERMDASTINVSSFVVLSLGGTVEGSFEYTGLTAVFTPDNPFAANTTYAAAVTAVSRDLAGNPLEYNYVWDFTTGGIPDATRPSAIANEPANLAVGVSLNAGLSVTFSEAMDPTTLTDDRFLVTDSAGSVAGVVTGVGAHVTFIPEEPLDPLTIYTATMRSAVFDLAGNSMSVDHVWTFTTGALDDDLAPLVIRSSPANLAVTIPVSAAITATFGDAMDVLTLHTSSFTLTALGVADVVGTVRFDGATRAATFTPSATLLPSTLYTATVTTEATDLAGNPLFVPHVWTFTTGANNLALVGPDMQTLNAFAAVAGAGLTNSNVIGTTHINGNVALTPSVECLGDGVPCVELNPSIDGNLYANDLEGVAARAQEDLTEAQIDLVGRVAGSPLNELAGLTLNPGVYTSGAAMTIAAGGTLTLDARGDANAVWIFQVGSSLTLNAAANVVIINGGHARNVFWAVTTSSTLGAGAGFRGNLVTGAAVSLGTGAFVEGRLLSLTGQITLLGNTITMPPL